VLTRAAAQILTQIAGKLSQLHYLETLCRSLTPFARSSWVAADTVDQHSSTALQALMASQPAGIVAGVSSCVTLAGHIMDLLMTAKGNKEEFRSLLVAVQSIYSFLKDLPEDGVTPQGTKVLRKSP
jgi:hypothetical protein